MIEIFVGMTGGSVLAMIVRMGIVGEARMDVGTEIVPGRLSVTVRMPETHRWDQQQKDQTDVSKAPEHVTAQCNETSGDCQVYHFALGTRTAAAGRDHDSDKPFGWAAPVESRRIARETLL